jgi:AcrR family transcriptional regulator
LVRKRKIRQRDTEATKKKLLDAVGAIMREHGFTGLKTNAIAKWVGKDKKLIRYHFQGLANLQKAYIKEKDYWPPFFKKFALSNDADALEMEILFVELMKENLRFFYGDEEMQKIILWQISEANPVLKSISQAREADGAKLLDRTDPFFRNTNVNFRAVIALMLGGVYYIVLHSKTNNSVVCGMNLNDVKDRDEVLKTIEQLISWSWKQVVSPGSAASKSLKSHYEFQLLESLASRFQKNFTEEKADPSLADELRAELSRVEEVLLEKLLDLTTETQIKTFLKINLFRLVQIADSFYLEKDHDNQESKLIGEMILNVISPVIDMVWGGLQLPMVLWESNCIIFKKDVKFLQEQCRNLQIEPELGSLALTPFHRFLEGIVRMKWQDFLYLNRYKNHLKELLLNEGVTPDELLNTMISLNLNDGGVITYFKTKIKGKILGQSDQQLKEILLDAKKIISQLAFFPELSFKPEKQHAVGELLKWLNSELDYLKDESLDLFVNPLKIKTKFTAPQLAVWQKLKYDNGLYDELNLEVLSEKIAGNFSTRGQDKLSPFSIKSKFYGKDSTVTGPIEKMLLKMLTDLRAARKGI